MGRRGRHEVRRIVVAVCSLAALLTVPASAFGCPNEFSPGFRSYLPDCRAYERVTPAFKDGFPVLGLGFIDGSAADEAPLIVGESLGAFAGGPDTESEVSDYVFKRDDSGWETFPVEPEPEDYVADPLSALGYVIGEGGVSLLALRRPSESIYAEDLFRHTLAGALEPIGPMLPPYAVPAGPAGLRSEAPALRLAGASPDLSHVLFYVRPALEAELPPGASTDLWPDDTTVAEPQSDMRDESLYEYAGSGSARPALVGVNDEGGLISQCGVELGGAAAASATSYGDIDHAVADGGSVVLFTANPSCPGGGENGPGYGPPTYELFARVGNEHTVAISEPTSQECPECETAPPRPAIFAGASEDGSKVFFRTEQALLLSDRDHSMDLYEAELEVGTTSRLKRIVQVSDGGEGDATPGAGAEVQGVAGLSEDGSHVYFVARGKLTDEPRGGDCLAELNPVQQQEEEHEAGRCRPRTGADNLYLYQQDAAYPSGHTTFVATLEEADAGQWSAEASEPMAVTPEGQFVAFTSSAQLTADDTGTHQVFRYDAESEELTRISIGEEDYNDDGNADGFEAVIERRSFAGSGNISGGLLAAVDTHPAISDDGSIVVFDSSDALTPQASEKPGLFNVYEYRAGHVYLISGGQTSAGFGSLALGVSGSGEDIIFRTYAPLLEQDTDTEADIYDARVDGGFPEPAQEAGCTGEGCRQPAVLAPALAAPQSNGRDPEGNLPPPAPTTKPKVLTRSEKLAAAIRTCDKKPKKQRNGCIERVKRRYAIRKQRVRPSKIHRKAERPSGSGK